jgi:hypothetical protein
VEGSPSGGDGRPPLATPTLADRTWTEEQRLTGEKREAFIRRILLGETAEIVRPT